MRGKWKSATIGSTCHVTDGAHSKVKRQNEGLMYLTSKNIKKGSLDLNKIDYISEKDFDKLFPSNSKARRRLQTGDILIGIIGTFGNAYVYKSEDSFCISSSVGIIRPDQNELIPEYLYYLITDKRFSHIIDSYKSGSVQGYTNIPTIKSIPINYPPLPEQKAIAHILGTLDDKIELNRKMNETLEEMAQALFKSWFVDFDPVIDKALAAGNEIPEPLQQQAEQRKAVPDDKKLLHTNPELVEVFPDRFIFTEELGWIPEGWEVKTINKAIHVNPSTPLKKEVMAQHADMKAIPEKGFNIEGVIWKPYKGGSKFINGDVLFARITPCLENGKTGIVDFLKEGEVGFGSTEFIVFRSKEKIKTPFIACLARNEDFRMRCIQSMVGSSGRQRVQNTVFDDIKLSFDNELLSLFDNITSPFFEDMSSSKHQNISLQNLRDTLLPKLISGELRVQEAEKIIADHG